MTRLTIVALHGNGGGGERFARVVPFASAGVRWVTPTLPGFGGRGLGSVADLEGLVGAVIETVDAAKVEGVPTVILGHGIGGSLALTALQTRPDLAEGLILHAVVGPRLDRRLLPLLLRPRAMKRLAQSLISGSVTRELFRARLFPHLEPGERRALTEPFFDAYKVCAAFPLLFEWLTPDWFAGLKPVGVRTGLLWGNGDRVLKPEQMTDLVRLVPVNAVQRVVEGWAHFPMIEQPEQYAQTVEEMAWALVG